MAKRRSAANLAALFRGTGEARALEAAARDSALDLPSALRNLAARAPAPSGGSRTPPIFIVSAGWRAGSTLLQRMCIGGNHLIWGEPYHFSEPLQALRRQMLPFADPGWPPPGYIVGAQPAASLADLWVANLYPGITDLVAAHRAYLDALFEAPALRLGYQGWGVKEVHWTMDDVRYLRFLYPDGRFLFLVRNPWDAWRSYRNTGRRWFWRWPDETVRTPWAFGRLWAGLASDFADHHQEVGGRFVRYEDLGEEATRRTLSDYLGMDVADPATLEVTGSRRHPRRPGQGVSTRIEQLEMAALRRAVGAVAPRLGYHGPTP